MTNAQSKAAGIRYKREREEAETSELRDQFAMAAMQGMAANSEIDMRYDVAAEVAYKQADAMLAARSQTQTKETER